MAKFCTNCGRELNNGAVFCENCGARNDGGTPVQAAQTYQTVPQKKSNGCAIAGFVISLLCGCFLAPIAFILSIIGISKSKTCGSGKGLAIAGLIISIITMLFGLLFTFLTIVPIVIEASENGDDWYEAIEEAFDTDDDYNYGYGYYSNSTNI